jgi:hypothetical protein
MTSREERKGATGAARQVIPSSLSARHWTWLIFPQARESEAPHQLRGEGNFGCQLWRTAQPFGLTLIAKSAQRVPFQGAGQKVEDHADAGNVAKAFVCQQPEAGAVILARWHAAHEVGVVIGQKTGQDSNPDT